MRIVHYCSGFSRLSETFVYDVITELEGQQLNNIVFTNERLNEADRPFKNVVVFKDRDAAFFTKVITKLMLLSKLRNYQQVKLQRRIKKLYTLLKLHKPHLIHCHFGPQGCAALPAAMKYNIPVMVSFHGYDAFRLPRDKFWRTQYQFLFNHAAAITAVSQTMKDHLVQLGCPPGKVHVIHVGKRLDEYAYRENTTVPVRTFLSIGRLEEKKGHLDAIRVFAKLAPNYPHLRLKIIGSGSMLQKAHDLVAQLNLQQVVTLTGGLHHADVKKELAATDAFILCSKTAANGDKEGVPTVLMEAQAIGLPCVSTRHSGIPEVIPHESQWVLGNESDIDGLAQIVERLMHTPKDELDRLRNLGRRKIEQDFDLEKEIQKLVLLYKTIGSA